MSSTQGRGGADKEEWLSKLPIPHKTLLECTNTNMTTRINNDPSDVGREKTLVLDLDCTLIYASRHPGNVYDFTVTVTNRGHPQKYYVQKRPGVDEFLSRISKMFEVVVFTIGPEDYASQIIDIIDSKKHISRRFYRDSCTKLENGYVKDLSKIGRDLKNVVIVDDREISFSLQPKNGIHVRPFVWDVNDRELEKVGDFLNWLYYLPDLRDATWVYPLWETLRIYGPRRLTFPRLVDQQLKEREKKSVLVKM